MGVSRSAIVTPFFGRRTTGKKKRGPEARVYESNRPCGLLEFMITENDRMGRGATAPRQEQRRIFRLKRLVTAAHNGHEAGLVFVVWHGAIGSLQAANGDGLSAQRGLTFPAD